MSYVLNDTILDDDLANMALEGLSQYKLCKMYDGFAPDEESKLAHQIQLYLDPFLTQSLEVDFKRKKNEKRSEQTDHQGLISELVEQKVELLN